MPQQALDSGKLSQLTLKVDARLDARHVEREVGPQNVYFRTVFAFHLHSPLYRLRICENSVQFINMSVNADMWLLRRLK